VPPLLRRERLAGQVVRFGMVGVLNTLVDFGAFNLLVFVFGVPVLVAYPFSVTAGIVNSFLWNKHWTFSAARSATWRREAVVFLGVSVSGLLINWAGFTVLHLLMGSSAALVLNLEKLAASVVSMVWNFVGYRFLAFRAHRKEQAV
jgi:putative flippase GtrA